MNAREEKRAMYEAWLQKSRLPEEAPEAVQEPLVQKLAKMLPVKIADWPDLCVKLQEEYPGADFAILWPVGAVGLVLEVKGD
jgi:hypothetical protein